MAGSPYAVVELALVLADLLVIQQSAPASAASPVAVALQGNEQPVSTHAEMRHLKHVLRDLYNL